MIFFGLFHWGFCENEITEISSRGVFFQAYCWLHIPLDFLHFGSWPFNLLIFFKKVFKLFWKKTLRKWNLLCIWLKTKITKQIVLLLKFCVKKAVPTWLTWLFVSISIKKTLEHFFLGFRNEVCCSLFNSLDFLSQYQQSFWYLLFLFIAYTAIDWNKVKK